MAGRRHYGMVFLVAALALAAGTAVVFGRIYTAGGAASRPSSGDVAGPGASRVAEAPARDSASATARPDTATTPLASNGAGRRETIANGALERPERASPPAWRPSPEQAMRDRVYRLTSAGDVGGAITTLNEWVAAHPEDWRSTRESARLLMRAGRYDEASARYRQLLARRTDDETRAEYARAMLDAQRYSEAAAQFRTLARSNPTDTAYRLGLAKSLAWGGKPGEAEPELRWLAQRLPQDTLVAGMLRSVRASYEPTAAEARRWVAEQPGYAPYRLALARALVREHSLAAASAQLDTLLASGERLDLLREAAGIRASANDSVGAARLLGRAVALAPGDTALRRQHAEALAWSGDQAGAIDEYTALLGTGRDPSLLLARGRLRIWSRDYAGGIADLRESAELQPSFDAYALLGDAYRWRGQFKPARAMYDRALALRPGDAKVVASLVALGREEHALLVAGYGGETELGWTLQSRYAEDNTGFLFIGAGLSRGVALGRSTVLSASFEQRRISQRSFNAPEEYLYGFSAGLGLSHSLGATTVSAQGGVARHALVRTIPYGSVSLRTTKRPFRASVEVGTGPVYTTLMTTRALLDLGDAGFDVDRPLVARSVSTTGGVTLGRADVSVGVDRMALSDGNVRTAVNAGVRYPLVAGLSALYAGGGLGYRERSPLYWDPTRYTSQSLGLEYTVSANGLRASLRALPGIGRSADECSATANPVIRANGCTSMQLALGGDVALHRRRYDVALQGGYGGGRDRFYRALNGSILFRHDW